jgi:hypothetical protein
VIHVPDRALEGAAEGDDGDGAAPVRKKTRRGSRGGKNRRKKPVGAGGAAVATAEPEAADGTEDVSDAEVSDAEVSDMPEPVVPEPESSENGDGDWGYTPMSQWGLDE